MAKKYTFVTSPNFTLSKWSYLKLEKPYLKWGLRWAFTLKPVQFFEIYILVAFPICEILVLLNAKSHLNWKLEFVLRFLHVAPSHVFSWLALTSEAQVLECDSKNNVYIVYILFIYSVVE